MKVFCLIIAVLLLIFGVAVERRGETDEAQWKMDVDGLVLEAREKEKRLAQAGKPRGKYSACPYRGK